MTVSRRAPLRGHTGLASPASAERLCFSGSSSASSGFNALPTYANIAAREPTPPSSTPAQPAPAKNAHAPAAPPAGPSVHSIIVVPESTRQAAPFLSQEWHLVLGKRGRRSSTLPPPESGVNAGQQPSRRELAAIAFKEELRGRCFRCFSHEHHVSQCKDEARCLHCLDEGHSSRKCSTRHLLRVPLPPLPATRRRPPKPPVHSRLVFPPNHPNSLRQPVHTRLQPAFHSSPPQLLSPVPSVTTSSRPTMPASNPGFIRRALRTKVVLEHTPEMVQEENRLRESALVLTVSGECPRLTIGQVGDGLLEDFPDLPPDGFQISLIHPRAFFVRFADPRWFALVAAQNRFHFAGMPIFIRRWTRLTFAAFRKYRYSVRLYLERLTPQAWSVATVQKALPGCLIHTIAEETHAKLDLSYYVVKAWVDRLEDVPTEATIEIHEPSPCVDLLPSGLSTPDGPSMRRHQEYLQNVPPRFLSTTFLVHLDSSKLIRPASAARGRSSGRDDDGFFDDDDDSTRTEEEIHPWTHGLADDAWHQRLEAASSGSAAGQHRPRPRNGGGRRRQLTPEGFAAVPLTTPPAGDGVTVDAGRPNGDGVGLGTASPTGPLGGGTGSDSALVTHPAAALSTDQHGPPLTGGLSVNISTPLNSPVPPTSPSRHLTLFPESVVVQESPLQFAALGRQAMELLQHTTQEDEPVLQPATATGDVALGSLLLAADGGQESAVLTPSQPDAPGATRSAPALMGRPKDGPMTQLGGPELTPTSLGPVLEEVALPSHDGGTPIAKMLGRVQRSITPALLPTPAAAPPRLTRRRRTPGSATRRSHRVQNRKKELTGGGNTTMRLAHRLIISKKGLAIAEPGEEDSDRAVEEYSKAFDGPLDDNKIEALTALAKAGHAKSCR